MATKGNRGHLHGQTIRGRERLKVDEGEARRLELSEMEARGHVQMIASLAVMKIPWVLVMFLGLILSLVSRVI